MLGGLTQLVILTVIYVNEGIIAVLFKSITSSSYTLPLPYGVNNLLKIVSQVSGAEPTDPVPQDIVGGEY